MSNGYLMAAAADLPAARSIADGFGLEVIDASSVTETEAVADAIAAAPNLGIILSAAAAHDEAFLALLRGVAAKASRAQLILAEPDAQAAFGFLPAEWPAMSLEEASRRAAALATGQEAQEPPPAAATPQEPAPAVEPEPAPEPAPEAAPEPAPEAPPALSAEPAPEPAPSAEAETFESGGGEPATAPAEPEPPAKAAAPPPEEDEARAPASRADDALPPSEPPAPAPQAPPAAAAPPAEPLPAPAPVPAPQSAPPPARKAERSAPAAAAPADATAFAPKKLRRGTPELVRIVIHQPKDLAAVIRAARKIDPSAAPAPQGMPIGDVPFGATIGVALEVRGAQCDGTLQRRTWAGDPIDFAFSVEADAEVRQVVLLARVFINDAQIGVIAFTRPVSGPAKKPASGDRARLKRHKRVFLSYSSQDRETVSTIATAYRMAGVEHFWDRTSLKSGEEWSPRLRREIDRADLFHLCWSRSAAASEWVEKEAQHALNRRRRAKKPDITVQMLDGPPWAPHPASLDSINFDDFVRAAIVGYARGDG